MPRLQKSIIKMCKYTRDPKTLQIHTECGHELCDDELEYVPLFRYCPFCGRTGDLILTDDSDLAMANETLGYFEPDGA